MQTSVEIHVLQGERPMATDNKSLGKFILDGIPPAQRGIPQIEVTFDIDADGILNVTAQDKATGKSQHITIHASSGLAEDEIERMRQEAEQHAEEDSKRKESIENRNAADSAVYQAQRALNDLGENADEDVKEVVEQKIADVQKALEGDDAGEMKRTTEALYAEVQKMSAAAYSASEAAPGGDSGPQDGDEGSADGEPDDDVIEGEFEEA